MVIPARREAANPESRTTLGVCVWIPGSPSARLEMKEVHKPR